MQARFFTLTALLLALSGPAACADGLKINLVNYAGVSPEITERARSTAAEVFSRAGVKSSWCECVPDSVNTCPTGAITILLIGRDMRERLNMRSEALGMALMTENGLEGNSAYIFLDRIEDLTASVPAGRKIMTGRLMGHVIAHEIGHLVLGAGNHVRHSIMTAAWGHHEVLEALQGALLFSDEHSARMRDALRDRSGLEVAGGN